MNKPTPTYEEMYTYLLRFAKKLEAGITENTTSRKANSAESSYLSPYSPSDDQYEDATELYSYMGERGDVDAILDFLLCSKALKEGKPRPPSRSRRQEPPREELKIKQPIWSKLRKETRDAWIRESEETKDMIDGQFAGKSKAIVPATKNHNLCTAYNINSVDTDGYDSDFTQNSDGTFQFIANSSTMYDMTDDESNGESVSEEQDLNINAAALTRPKKGILKRGEKKLYKSSEMPAAAVAKMMASKQLEVRDPVSKESILYYVPC